MSVLCCLAISSISSSFSGSLTGTTYLFMSPSRSLQVQANEARETSFALASAAEGVSFVNKFAFAQQAYTAVVTEPVQLTSLPPLEEGALFLLSPPMAQQHIFPTAGNPPVDHYHHISYSCTTGEPSTNTTVST